MNPYILWSPSYSVGNATIDLQHRKIINLINQLFREIEEGLFDGTDEILTAIGRYTRIHFTFEENLLKNSAYPELESHMELHRKMAERTNALVASPPKCEETARKLLLVLREWWLDHILLQDQGYASFIGQSQPQKVEEG